MNPTKFLTELKRRNVYKVAIAYAVVAWLLIQIATQVFPFFEIPNWTVRLVVLLIAIGFPIALIIAWAFELTPQGIKRTEDVGEQPHSRGGAWIYIAVIGAALSIGLFFVGRYTAPRTSEPRINFPEKSIAVLPFENLSRDPDNAYFTEGVQEEILTRLAKIADLKVISRSSTQRFKSPPKDLREIAEELGVTNVLEGSVQKAADQVRVNVQLINALTEAHLWAETYDRKLSDIFAVESDIAKTIADILQAKLTGSEKVALAQRPTVNSEAHELYLKGRFFWNKRTGADLWKAIEYFKQAIDKDPKYATAYAGLADSYVLLPFYGGGSPQESFPPAKTAAKKALELDDSLAEAHTSLGFILAIYDRDVPGSIKEFERAITINPNYATAHHWFGNSTLQLTKEFDRSIAEGKRAVELDPLSLVINADLANDYIIARRYDEAIAQLRKTLEMDPRFYHAHWYLGEALELKGDLRKALAEYRRAAELDDDPFVLGFIGAAYAKLGQPEEARKILEQMQEMGRHRYLPDYSFALVHMALGETDKAIDLLEQNYRSGDAGTTFIQVDPLLDPLRGNPRFEALAAKVLAPKNKD